MDLAPRGCPDAAATTRAKRQAGRSPATILRNAQGTTLYLRGRDIEDAEHALSFDRAACRWTILGKAEEVHSSEQRGAILAVLEPSVYGATVNAAYMSNGLPSKVAVVVKSAGMSVIVCSPISAFN